MSLRAQRGTCCCDESTGGVTRAPRRERAAGRWGRSCSGFSGRAMPRAAVVGERQRRERAGRCGLGSGCGDLPGRAVHFRANRHFRSHTSVSRTTCGRFRALASVKTLPGPTRFCESRIDSAQAEGCRNVYPPFFLCSLSLVPHRYPPGQKHAISRMVFLLAVKNRAWPLFLSELATCGLPVFGRVLQDQCADQRHRRRDQEGKLNDLPGVGGSGGNEDDQRD